MQPRISLCMIVRNEETNIADCIGPIASLMHEIIVVDTGSTDGTREIAVGFGARIVEFPWIDDFAAARNEGLRRATGDWIFWMDADDRLDVENLRRLRTLFSNLADENACYVMQCLCATAGEGESPYMVEHLRLFRNHPQMRWQHRIHEQILPAALDLRADVRNSDVVIRHGGYVTTEQYQQKLERNLRLLRMALTERPEDPYIFYNLGSTCMGLGRFNEALPWFLQGLQRADRSCAFLPMLYAQLTEVLRRKGRLEEALSVCRTGRGQFPVHVELLFQEALLCEQLGDDPQAEACLKQLVDAPTAEWYGGGDVGARSYKALHNLALIYKRQKRWAEAESQWQAILAEQPDSASAWQGLGSIYLQQQRWEEMDRAVTRLELNSGHRTEAALLRARAHLTRGEYAAAKQQLNGAIARSPRSLAPRIGLSHVLMLEGRDWPAAEQALRDVLALEPTHAETLRNLAILEKRRGAAPTVRIAGES
jgi:glycosyltransferase involved in cell wall biosynthesis/predicted Zn-dependent protease